MNNRNNKKNLDTFLNNKLLEQPINNFQKNKLSNQNGNQHGRALICNEDYDESLFEQYSMNNIEEEQDAEIAATQDISLDTQNILDEILNLKSYQEIEQSAAQNSQKIIQNPDDTDQNIAFITNQIQMVNDFVKDTDNQDQQEKKLIELERLYKFVCRECIKPFPEYTKFSDHMIERHPVLAVKIGVAQYLCKICQSKAFKLKRMYLAHLIDCFCAQKGIKITHEQKKKMLISIQLKNADQYEKQLGFKSIDIQ